MKVSIYSKPELFKIIKDKGLPPNTAVISFTDEGFGEFLEFYDHEAVIQTGRITAGWIQVVYGM